VEASLSTSRRCSPDTDVSGSTCTRGSGGRLLRSATTALRRETAQHTLESCPAWDAERRVLTGKIGGDLSLPAVVTEMLASAEAWDAVASFCDNVISQKEAAERAREVDPNAPAEKRRRRGGRRRRFLQGHL
jgi:hypothetical protein